MGILAMESIVLGSATRVHKRGSLQLQGNHDLTLSLCTSPSNSPTTAGPSSTPGTPVGVHRSYRRSNSGQQISVMCTQNDPELMCNRPRTRASTPGPSSMTHSRSHHQLQSSASQAGRDLVYMTQGGAIVSQGGAAQRHSFGGSGQWLYMPRGLQYYNGHHPNGRHSIHSHRTSWLIGELAGLYQSDYPLKFHQIRGDNVELNADASIAKRGDSFCKAICFSNRPIAINEKVYIKFAETSSSWSGVLRFGFTNIDPGSLRGADLPRYACPDMTNKQGNWAKALAERYATPNNTLHFYATRTGDVFYGVNSEDVGLFFTGVNTSLPLWALFDIYGNTLAVEFANPEPIRLNNMVMSPTSSSGSSVNRDLASSLSSLSINSAPASETLGGFPPIRYYANLTFTPLKWHMLTGKNLQVSPDHVVATRSQDEYCNGYVFSSRPLKCGEKIVIQILGVDRSYVGGLGVGLTACNPSRVQLEELPDDSDLLLDRPEYWVVNKDVCRSPDVGDELCFHLTNEGELRYSRNNQRVSTLLHVDRTLPLWIFFDVYGNVQKIRPLGTTVHLPPVPPRPRSTSYLGAQNSLTVMLPPRDQQPQAQNLANMSYTNVDQSGVSTNPNPQPHMLRSYSVPAHTLTQMSSPTTEVQKQPVSMPNTPNIVDSGDPEVRDECTVCYERQVNAALYTCGHLCMCFECAIQVKQRKGGLCPICRQEIKDVIRIYKT